MVKNMISFAEPIIETCIKKESSRSDTMIELGSFWCEVFMHAQASMSTGIWLHPARVESVVRLEFAPVWHGRPLKVPTGGLFGEPCLSYLAVF